MLTVDDRLPPDEPRVPLCLVATTTVSCCFCPSGRIADPLTRSGGSRPWPLDAVPRPRIGAGVPRESVNSGVAFFIAPIVSCPLDAGLRPAFDRFRAA